MPLKDVQGQWNQMAMWIELVPNYPHFNVSNFGEMPRFNFFDKILAKLLYMNLVALLDDSLAEFLNSRPNAERVERDLYGRLSRLEREGLLSNFAGLDRIRQNRNELAHESLAEVTWQDLREAAKQIGDEFVHLGILYETPAYQFVAGKSQARTSEAKPDLIESSHYFGLDDAQTGQPSLRCTWTQSTTLGQES